MITYEEALRVMTAKQSLGIMPGLNRIQSFLASMGNPQNKLNIIHVAGTNGKGSIAAAICNSLIRCGKTVGLFTSPWVVNYREQIQINAEYISRRDFAEYVARYRDNDCTEFEFLTAIMYRFFADRGVDYAVVECGMGGAGDATNVETKNISVITSVSLDHTDFLGDTIEKIAREKAGIIKPGSTCILYPNPECVHIIEEKCRVFDATLIKVSETGSPIQNNIATAAAVLRACGFDCEVTLPQLPGRREMYKGIMLDGGHNPAAGACLAASLNHEVALIGMMRDKDVDGYLSLVAPHCKKIITTSPNNLRSMSALKLASVAGKYCGDVIAVDNSADALDFAVHNGLTLVCGSFYLIREIRNLI